MRLLAFALASLVGLPAFAQLAPFTRTTAPYVPLTNATPLAIPPGGGFFSVSDEGFIAVQLPFTFPFNGANFQTVFVHVNGLVLLTLPTSCLPTATICTSARTPVRIPAGASATVPNYVAAFWHDWELVTPNAQMLSAVSSNEATFEWRNVTSSSNGFTADFQVTLESNGNTRVHYGPRVGTPLPFETGVAGYQSGTLGFATLGASCTATAQSQCCGSTAFGSNCNGVELVPDTLVTTEPPLQPDLIAQSVRVSNFQTVLPSGDLSMTVTARVLNFSRSPANNWSFRAVLSPDPTLDQADGGPPLPDGGPRVNDVLLTPEATNLSLAPQSAADFSVNVSTTSPPPPGDFFVLVQVDSQNQVPESSEANNVATLPFAITSGVDLVASSVSGSATSGPNAQNTMRVQYFNRGGSAAGTVNYRIMLASGRDAGFVLLPDGGPVDAPLPDGGDGAGPAGLTVIHRGTRTVTGGETVDENVLVTLPPDAPNGDFFYVLQLDPGARLAETNERNNVVFSTGQVAVRRADLVLEAIELIDAVTRQPVRTVLFGETYRAIIRYRNGGGGTAENYRIGAILSNDSTLSLLSDTILAEQLIASTPASSTSITLELPVTLPVVDRTDAGLPGGNYFLFFALDTLGAVFESNKGNNTSNIGPVRAFAPAPDYTVATLQAPTGAGIGEVIPVFRTLRNVGNRAGSRVPYRYYASANTIVSPSDVPLELQLADGGTSLEGTVALASGAGDTATELVRLPTSMAPGTWFVGCLVDPTNTLAELNETNNALASSPVQVVQSSLRVVDSQLPDATVGRGYFYRLSAVGESSAATTWSLAPAQGALPEGLSLSASGELTGTPTGVGGTGVRAFTVVASNGGRLATARLVVRVLMATSQVEITTTSVPAIVNSPSAVFQLPLGAAGGSRPYTWRVAAGTLPPGLSFTSEGVLQGAPRQGTVDGTSRVTFEVRDALAVTARRELALRLVPPAGLVIRTTQLSDALTGQSYTQDIAAQNADNSALARPLTWTVTGALPPGLGTAQEGEVFSISGRPTRAGLFRFTLSVEDARGRRDSFEYTLAVYTNRFRVLAADLPQVLRPGDTVAVTFSTVPAGTVRWSLLNGTLPSGLSFSPEGTLSGTIEDVETNVSNFSFVVEAKDDTGASGLAPFGFVVERAPRLMNCSAVDVGPLGALLALCVLVRPRRRRA
jgi:hypothetical protein